MPGTLSQNITFVVLVALTTLAFVALLLDFLMPVFWAAVLATLFQPLQRRYVRAVGGRRSIAAVLTILTIVVLVVAPLFLLGVAMSREAIALHQQVTSGAIDLKAPVRFLQRIAPLASRYLDWIGLDLDRIGQQLSSAAVTASQYVASSALAIGQNVLAFTALFFVMLYVLFFFLRDGRELVDALVHALPLGEARERRLIAKFAEVSRATIKGTLVVGVVQGALGGVLFWLLGIPAPVFWGAVMVVFAILPAVGTGLVWGPAAIILLALGHVVKGIVLLAVGVLLIGMVDNLLRPILIGRDTKMPDYLVLLATLGGIAVFGISGFVIGPIIASFFLAVWDMFAEEYSDRRMVTLEPTPPAVASEPAGTPGAEPAPPAPSRAPGRGRTGS
jgi:predicted PurR-regulated permease PerM